MEMITSKLQSGIWDDLFDAASSSTVSDISAHVGSDASSKVVDDYTKVVIAFIQFLLNWKREEMGLSTCPKCEEEEELRDEERFKVRQDPGRLERHMIGWRHYRYIRFMRRVHATYDGVFFYCPVCV